MTLGGPHFNHMPVIGDVSLSGILISVQFFGLVQGAFALCAVCIVLVHDLELLRWLHFEASRGVGLLLVLLF